MGKVTGFLEYDRQEQKYQLASDRIRHFREFVLPISERDVERQAARCMDCGIPFCHTGCPVNNQIPDWNDLVYHDDWQQALQNLHSTNNFPEFTGRICPAPCEASCTLNLFETPVTIKSIECALVDRGWQEGWISPQVPSARTGKKVAIVGAGPAGMACAQQLARAGHDVQLFDRQAKPGGLMRYGIPDFKMEKRLIDRRMEQMRTEGVVFHGNVHVGVDMPAAELVNGHDAVVLTGGSETPRDLAVEGRALAGIHFAMDFLPQQNRRVGGEAFDAEPILATDKHVVVIGGGDTGSDCIGTSFRQGALSVTQIE
ncbi:MAG: glutamate synthase subunit beta, partial [Hyphomicrobiales bacterium]